VLATTVVPGVGGNAFDAALVDYLIKEFQKYEIFFLRITVLNVSHSSSRRKTKHDITDNKKACMKLFAAAESAREVPKANKKKEIVILSHHDHGIIIIAIQHSVP
jgi:molecular chaperone DnaK (HSP70)